MKGSLWAAAAGATVAFAATALDGVEAEWATPRYSAAALLAGGAVAGLMANRFIGQDLGKGLVAGSVALGGYKLYKALKLEQLVAKQKNPTPPAATSGMGVMPWQPPQMQAIQAPIAANQYATMSAVGAQVGPDEYATLSGLY
jgi:hypothetical protein